jgi:peptidoglycan/xylan/chitin deacetylase (PgdA/CDA1 family)
VLEVDQIRLRDKEVVSTVDDGPWPANAPAVLKVLIDECLKATIKRHIS